MNVRNLEGFPFFSFGEYRAASGAGAVGLRVNTEIAIRLAGDGRWGRVAQAFVFLMLAAPWVITLIDVWYALVHDAWLLLGLLLLLAAHFLSHPAMAFMRRMMRPLMLMLVVVVGSVSAYEVFLGQSPGISLLGASVLAIVVVNSALMSLPVKLLIRQANRDEELFCALWRANALMLTTADGRQFSSFSFAASAPAPHVQNTPSNPSEILLGSGAQNPAAAQERHKANAAVDAYCTTCGTPHPPSAQFCSACERALTPETGTQPPHLRHRTTATVGSPADAPPSQAKTLPDFGMHLRSIGSDPKTLLIYTSWEMDVLSLVGPGHFCTTRIQPHDNIQYCATFDFGMDALSEMLKAASPGTRELITRNLLEDSWTARHIHLPEPISVGIGAVLGDAKQGIDGTFIPLNIVEIFGFEHP